MLTTNPNKLQTPRQSPTRSAHSLSSYFQGARPAASLTYKNSNAQAAATVHKSQALPQLPGKRPQAGAEVWEKLKISMLMLHAYPRFLTAATKHPLPATKDKVNYFYKNAARLREADTRDTTLTVLGKIGGRSFRNYGAKERGQFRKLMADVNSPTLKPTKVGFGNVLADLYGGGGEPWCVAIDHERYWFGNKLLLSNARRRSFGKNKLLTDFEFHPRV